MSHVRLHFGMVAMSVAVVVVACAPARDASVPLAGDKCANYNGGSKKLQGDARKNAKRAREIAYEVRGQVLQVAPSPDGRLLLIPTCDVRKLKKKDLKEGRFVGILTGPGTAPDYSDVPNDVVYWWVFGTDTVVNGATTLVHHSQFVSLRSPTGSIVERATIVCPDHRDRDFPVDSVAWHDDTCPSPSAPHSVMRIGDNPWFGCTRGCCYSTKLQLLTDSLPADTTRADSARTDTTRRDTTP